jgi:hypothetical protein
MPPVGLNHSTAAVDFPLSIIQLSFRFDAERHNARINRARRMKSTRDRLKIDDNHSIRAPVE